MEAIAGFNRAMARETEGRDLDPERLARGVAAALEDPERARYWMAEVDGESVGSLMITPEWSDWRNGTFWWIQSVYVVPEARRSGVFRTLYESLRKRARVAEGVCGLRLYVDRENRSARAVYEAMGMVRTDYLLYEEDFVL